jgi:hypothetical protein
MRIIMGFLLVLTPVSSAYAKGWWSQACETLLSSFKPANVPRVQAMMDDLQYEVTRANRFSSMRLKAELREAEALAGAPSAVVIEPSLEESGRRWVKKPRLMIVATPKVGMVAFIDNVKVKTQYGEFSVLDMVKDELDRVRDKNPDLQFEMHTERAGNFPQVAVAAGFEDSTAVWLDGPIEDRHEQRTMVVALLSALESVAQDPRYMTSAPKD